MSVDVQIKDQVIQLSGFINFDNAEQVYQQGIALIKQYSGNNLIPVDLSQLTSSNTISLAVFVQWLRLCSPARKIRLIAVPTKMLDIIQASNLLDEFGL